MWIFNRTRRHLH